MISFHYPLFHFHSLTLSLIFIPLFLIFKLSFCLLYFLHYFFLCSRLFCCCFSFSIFFFHICLLSIFYNLSSSLFLFSIFCFCINFLSFFFPLSPLFFIFILLYFLFLYLLCFLLSLTNTPSDFDFTSFVTLAYYLSFTFFLHQFFCLSLFLISISFFVSFPLCCPSPPHFYLSK